MIEMLFSMLYTIKLPFSGAYSTCLCLFSDIAVCKILATELESRLDETGKTHEVLELGYSVDDVKPKRKTKYQKS
jgi:hypothetical protein